MLDVLVFDALADFRQVMALAQIDAPLDNVRRQILLKPHKASVKLESELERGARFCITFPRADLVPERPSQPVGV